MTTSEAVAAVNNATINFPSALVSSLVYGDSYNRGLSEALFDHANDVDHVAKANILRREIAACVATGVDLQISAADASALLLVDYPNSVQSVAIDSGVYEWLKASA